MMDQIFAASVDSIIITDNDGIVTQANPAAHAMLGYSKNELIGKPISCLYAICEEFEKVKRALDSKGKFKGEIVNRTNSGNEINSFLSANYVYNEEGVKIGIMGISRDITANITVRKEYEQLVKTISDIIFIADCEGRFTYVNNSIKKLLGYKPKDLIGTLFTDIINKEHLEIVRSQYHSHLDKIQTRSYLEFQVVKEDGGLLWVGMHVSTRFNLIRKKEIDGFYGVMRDIDKEKSTKLLLTESEKKYKNLLDSSLDLIHSVDLNGNFLYVNNSWKRIMGYTEEEVKDLNLFSLVHPNSKEQYSMLFNFTVLTGQSSGESMPCELIAKNGEVVIVEGSINALSENGKAVSIQSFLRNVTHQRAIEEQLVEGAVILRQITETLSDVFYLYNIVEKKYEYISSNCEAILGASDAFFFAGKSHSENYGHPDDLEKLMEAKRLVDSGIPYDIDYRIIIKDKVKWINEKSFPIMSESGLIVSNSGICRDITEFKNAQKTIYDQNLEIGASILYAKRLQESVLPSNERITAIFPDSFVIYKPKDIVSGDFFVVDYVRSNGHETMPVFIVGDCTGHGVPGAVLSLMCNVLIQESFTAHEVNSPSEALDFVRYKLLNFFRGESTKTIRDGMDVAFCVLNKLTNQLYFSGAYNSCVIIDGEELREYKGDKQHVGFTDNPKPFFNHFIDVKKGDIVYLYTDGFTDQFGGDGDRTKKFTRKRLHQFLLDTRDLPMQEVGMLLETKFLEWKGETEQTDDVTLLGVRIG